MTNPLIDARDAFSDVHPEQRIGLNGRDWGYLEAGAGPALLLIPGTLGRGDIFWQQIAALKDRLRLVAVTYPATGGIVDWCADLIELLDHLGIAQASVLGSSLGGYLAQYLAAEHPDRVDRLFAANTLHSAIGVAMRMPYALDLDTAPIDDLRGGFGTAMEAWGETHPDQADLVELLLREVGGRIPEAELRSRLRGLKTAPDLPPMPLPSDRLVTVEADDDPLIPPQMRAAVRARLAPDVAYRFTSGGHFPYVVRPQDYTSMLEQALGLTVTGPDWGTDKERVR
jgi:maspardin